MTRALLAAILAAGAASAAEKIGPVSGQLLTKSGRSELGAGSGLSVNDAFHRKVFVGGRYAYHLGESLAIEASGDYGIISFVSGAIERCSTNQPCTPADAAALSAAPGDVRAQAALAVQWAPVYGKLSLLAESVVHFDLFLCAGGGVVSYRGLDENGAAISPTTPAGVIGIGLRAHLNRWLALRFDARDVVYQAQVRGDADWQNQLEVGLSLSVFAP